MVYIILHTYTIGIWTKHMVGNEMATPPIKCIHSLKSIWIFDRNRATYNI